MCKEIPYEALNALQNQIVTPGQNVYMKGAFAPSPLPLALLPTVFERVAALSAPEEYRIGLLLEYFPLAAANAVPDDATAYPRALVPNILCAVYARDDGEAALAYTRDAARELIGLFGTGASVGYGNYSAWLSLCSAVRFVCLGTDPLCCAGPDSDAAPTEGAVPVDKAKLLFGVNYPKLQQIKKKYDPELIFNKWFNITPA